MASGDTKTEAMLNALGNGGSADEFRGCCNTKTQQYILDAIDRVQNVEDEVEELKNNPDVVDIVDTYADLQAYDTTHLSDNDIIRVLADETHSGNSTYYKFNKQAGTWTFIGEIAGGGGGAEFIELTTADYNWNSSTGATGTPDCVALWLLPSGIYKGPADSSIEVRVTKGQDYSMGAGFPSYAIVKECENTNTNRAIVTYVDASNGNVIEYCNIDENGQNYTVKNFPNVVQTTGTSTTNVMSQNAVTSMVFADSSDTTDKIRIGNSNPIGMFGVNIGGSASQSATTQRATNIGGGSGVIATGGTAIGNNANVNNTLYVGSVALGAYAHPTSAGQVHIGTTQTQYGYNSTNYRLLSGVHDPVDAHDAATKGYVDANAGGVKTLTSADYNYKYGGGDPDGVALWLLDEGQYIIEAGTDYYMSASSKSFTQQNTGVVILVKPTGTGFEERGGFIIQEYTRTLLVSRIDSTGNNGNQDELPRKLANNLTTSASGYALDARQGKVLNDKFGGMQLVKISQTDYDNLSTKDPNTLYIITGA